MLEMDRLGWINFILYWITSILWIICYYKIKYKTKIIDLKDVDLSVEHIDTDESIEDEVFSY